MIRKQTLFAVPLLIFVATNVWAQDIAPISKWLSRDTPALLTIPDPAGTYDRLKQLPVLAPDRWDEVFDSVMARPLFEVNRLEKLFDSMVQLDDNLPLIEEFHIAFHQIGDWKYTIFIKAEPEPQQELKAILKSIFSLTFAADEKSIEEIAELTWDEFNSLMRSKQFLQMGEFQDYLILSNDASVLKQFEKITSDESGDGESDEQWDEAKSLATDRTYKTIVNRSERFAGEDGLVSVYVKPKHMRWFFPKIDETAWDGYGYSDLPGAGLNFLVMEPSEDPNRPFIVADATLMFTQPRWGHALLSSYYRPATIPHLTVKPIELRTFGRDEVLMNEESNRCYDEMYGENSAANWYDSRYLELGLDFDTDVLKRRQGFLELQYMEGEQQHYMRMEHILNREAMLNYVEGTMKNVESMRGVKPSKVQKPELTAWKVDKESRKAVGYPHDYSTRIHADNYFLDAYMVGEEWYVSGEWPQVLTQINNLQDNITEVDHGQPIRDLVEDLVARTGGSAPYEIKYYEPQSWRKKVDELENNLVFIENNRMPIDLRPEVVDGVEIYRLKYIDDDGNATDVEGSPSIRKGEGSNFQLTLNKTDVAKADIKQEVGRLFAETMGRQLYIYNQDDSEIRIMMGCYPMPPEIEETQKK